MAQLKFSIGMQQSCCIGAPFAVCVLAICILSPSILVAEKPSKNWETDVKPLLKRYCYDCHADGTEEGDLTLDGFTSADDAVQHPGLWLKVLKNIRAGVMPPFGEDKPTSQETELIADWIKFDVFGINPATPDPGRLSVRRLNREEYGNTINDLMGTDFEAKLLFPADDSGSGFDNVGDALTFSPLLMEKYLKAARAIVDQAVPTQTKVIPLQVFSGRDFTSKEGSASDRSLNGKEPHHVKCSFEVTEQGPFNLDVAIKLHGSFDFDPSRYIVTFMLDGEERFQNEYGWDENKRIQFHFDETLKLGQHYLEFALDPVPSDPDSDESEGESTNVRFEIAEVRVEGPVDTDNLVHPPNYERFFSRDSPPDSKEGRREYAAEVLTAFASRAFRSSVASDTVARLVDVAESAYQQPQETFESGVAQAMVAVLCSPRFLFHLEAANHQADTAFGPVDESTLASRLSYFLWSTMPDDELFALARTGQLRANQSEQIKRMMKDRRSEAFLSNFVGQWLRTRDVVQITVDPLVILGVKEEYEEIRASFRRSGRRRSREEMGPEELKRYERYRELRSLSDRFDAELRRSMQLETEKTVEYILREDRSLLELLDCDYTFLNEQLAEHYGIEGVQGSDMRRVELTSGHPRGGLLTQASMLLVTSNPTRTSPVKRGLFILDNILGTPAPPAPPGVPELEAANSQFDDHKPTLRELLAVHRESAICSSCHARMDPLGLALENFDALGMWREMDKGQPIDTSGELITGESFENLAELKKVLREHHANDFYRCVTQKLMTYAIGRGLETTDEHSIDTIVNSLNEGGGRFSILLQGIVESSPFQNRRF